MKTSKNVGIWMDHSMAHIIEGRDKSATQIVLSDTMPEEKENEVWKGEKHLHNKEQREESEYYKSLGNSILDYDDVLLFGPTDAKAELANILKADHRFAHIKIETRAADKMTDNQEHAFVRDYFFKRGLAL